MQYQPQYQTWRRGWQPAGSVWTPTRRRWCGSARELRHNIDTVTVSEVQVLTTTVRVVSSARELGVVIDSRLTMADYVASVCRSAYYHLRQIRPTLQSLTVTPDGSKTLVSQPCQAIVSSSPGAWTTATRRGGQADHTDRSAWAHHTRSKELHWLPVRRRVDFKLATFMYKTLHGRIPRYLSGDCQLISDACRRLRLSDTFTFAVPRTKTRLGDRSFAVAGPQIWNSLQADLRLVDNYARFRRLLKGHMFGWGCGA